MQARPYQIDLLNAVRKGWDEFRKQLVVAPTGSGKTQCFSWMCEEEVNAGRRALILVDQDELVWQTLEKLKQSTGIIGQVEKAEFRASKQAEVVVATVQSMARRLESWPSDTFDLIIADEGDRSLSAQWQSVLKHFDSTARVCSLTATPNRLDKRNLGEYYENIAYEISLLELIKQGYLSKICIQMVPLRIDLSGVHLSQGDFDTTELDHAITPYLSSAVDALIKYAPTRKTLVFLPLIKTSEKFVALCRERGLSAEHIDGTSEDRADKLARFKRNEFSILANSSLLLRGYDDPKIDCIFFLRPTKSSTLFRQAIGRGTRIADGKENLLLIDCLYQSGKNLICRPATLIAKSDEEAEEITRLSEAQAGSEQCDLLDLATQSVHTREEALRKKLEAMAKRKSVFISADEFALRVHQPDLADFQPSMKWHESPMTDKQKEWVEKAGIDVDTVKSKGHASALLNVYFESRKSQPASPRVKNLLRWKRWRSPDGLRGPDMATQEDARLFFKSGVMKR